MPVIEIVLKVQQWGRPKLKDGTFKPFIRGTCPNASSGQNEILTIWFHPGDELPAGIKVEMPLKMQVDTGRLETLNLVKLL
ncbi:MAG: hypothetical protein AB1442_11140 [Nitrospirota bacterium]